jgi:hypothetical protein
MPSRGGSPAHQSYGLDDLGLRPGSTGGGAPFLVARSGQFARRAILSGWPGNGVLCQLPAANRAIRQGIGRQ